MLTSISLFHQRPARGQSTLQVLVCVGTVFSRFVRPADGGNLLHDGFLAHHELFSCFSGRADRGSLFLSGVTYAPQYGLGFFGEIREA